MSFCCTLVKAQRQDWLPMLQHNTVALDAWSFQTALKTLCPGKVYRSKMLRAATTPLCLSYLSNHPTLPSTAFVLITSNQESQRRFLKQNAAPRQSSSSTAVATCTKLLYNFVSSNLCSFLALPLFSPYPAIASVNSNPILFLFDHYHQVWEETASIFSICSCGIRAKVRRKKDFCFPLQGLISLSNRLQPEMMFRATESLLSLLYRTLIFIVFSVFALFTINKRSMSSIINLTVTFCCQNNHVSKARLSAASTMPDN